MTRAELLRQHLEPLDGNPLAAMALFRLVVADDPEAEADRIIEEWGALRQRVVAVFTAAAPMLRKVYDAAGPN